MFTSDQIHNQNCQRYLAELFSKTSEFVVKGFVEPLSEKSKRKFYYTADKKSFSVICKNYSKHFPYGDLYTQFLTYLEDNIERFYDCYKKDQDKIEDLDACVDAIYHNDNGNLKATYQHIELLVQNNRPVNTSLEKKIASTVKDNGQRVNSTSPSKMGSGPERFLQTFFYDEFKPMLSTRLPTLPEQLDLGFEKTKFYSFGTQAQRHSEGGDVIFRVSPLFKAWLRVQKKKNKGPHLYINNLGWDRDDFEGKKEKAMTEVLHALNGDEHLDIIVITLPADKGLMGHDYFKKTSAKTEKQRVFNDLENIALENGKSKRKVKDFYIPDNLKALLFKGDDGEYSKAVEQAKIKQLLNQSFKRVLPKGLQADDAQLSGAQIQAVWFDFLKFQLPNYIITELNPAGVNFSCKDAIDRGGVSLAYFSLMQSLDKSLNDPNNVFMSREQFEKMLHAAPTMVKGRGMNGHLQVIWNAIDCYVRQHHKQLVNEDKAWLVEWRNDNCPHSRVDDVLIDAIAFSRLRLQTNKDELNRSPGGQFNLERATTILKTIDSQRKKNVSGKRLLLESASTTPAMLFDPGSYKDKYERVCKDVECNYPKLKMLAGMMRVFMGGVLLIPSLGKSFTQVVKGLQTCKAAFYNQGRQKLASNMQALSAPAA